MVLTLSRGPHLILFSRVFSKLSPIIHRLIGGVLVRCISYAKTAIIVSARGLHRLRNFYSRVNVLRHNKLLLRGSVSYDDVNIFEVRFTVRSRSCTTLGPGLGVIGRHEINGVTRLAVGNDRSRVLSLVGRFGPLFYRVLPLALRRLFVDRVRRTNCSVGGLFTWGGPTQGSNETGT